MTSTTGEPIFTTSAAQALLEESEEQGRGTPLVPEMYFGGEGSNVNVYLYASSGPLAKPAHGADSTPKFVFRDPFVNQQSGGRAPAPSTPQLSQRGDRSASDVTR